MWCPLEPCDDLISQRGKTTVQSQLLCTVHAYTFMGTTLSWIEQEYWHKHQHCMVPRLWPYSGRPFFFSLRTFSKALKGSWKSYLAFYTVISSPSTSDISTSEFSLTKSSSSTSWGKPANPWIKVVFNSAISMNILSCGIKLHRFQQHFRLLRTSTCLRQFQVLVKDYLHDLFHLHCIIF